MSFCCRSGARSLVTSAFIVAFAALPTFARSQALTLVQSATRYVGTPLGAGFNGDFASAATTISLNGPSYIVFDSNGNQYISDTLNNCVRKIDPTGEVTTLVGLAMSSGGDTCFTAKNATPLPTDGL